MLVNKNFNAIQKQLELLDKRIEVVENEIRHVNARLNTIEHNIAEIQKHFVYRDEFDSIVRRLAAVEKRLGIKSGKWSSDQQVGRYSAKENKLAKALYPHTRKATAVRPWMNGDVSREARIGQSHTRKGVGVY